MRKYSVLLLLLFMVSLVCAGPECIPSSVMCPFLQSTSLAQARSRLGVGGTNDFIRTNIANGKGALAVFNGVFWTNLPAGVNGQVVTADSTTSTGIKYAAGGSSSFNNSQFASIGGTTNIKSGALLTNTVSYGGGGTNNNFTNATVRESLSETNAAGFIETWQGNDLATHEERDEFAGVQRWNWSRTKTAYSLIDDAAETTISFDQNRTTTVENLAVNGTATFFNGLSYSSALNGENATFSGNVIAASLKITGSTGIVGPSTTDLNISSITGTNFNVNLRSGDATEDSNTPTGDINIITGDESGSGNASSGSINIYTGSPAGTGVAGDISLIGRRYFVSGLTAGRMTMYSAQGLTNVPAANNWAAVPTNAVDASSIATGTMATARLGSGSATSSTYLRGDSTWAAVSAGTSFDSNFYTNTATTVSLSTNTVSITNSVISGVTNAALKLVNPLVATSGNQKETWLELDGNGFATGVSASQTFKALIGATPIQAANNVGGRLNFGFSTNNGPTNCLMFLNSGGDLNLNASQIQIGPNNLTLNQGTFSAPAGFGLAIGGNIRVDGPRESAFVVKNVAGTTVAQAHFGTTNAVVTANTSITALDVGKVYTGRGTTNLTLTLPLATNGMNFEFNNDNLTNITLTAVGSDTIRDGGYVTGAAGSLTVLSNQVFRLNCSTNGFWYVSYKNGVPPAQTPVAITFPATTATWTNTTQYVIEMNIDNFGITGTAMSKNGTQVAAGLIQFTTMVMVPGDYFSETYTVGTPVGKYNIIR